LRCCSTLTNACELLARHAHHAQIADFAATAQIEHGQADDTDLLVRTRCTTTDEAGGVLAGANLDVR
jgi:hypothetical protein